MPRGRAAFSVIGFSAVGAGAGHEIEKHARSTQHHTVAARMDDGISRTFSCEAEPAFRAGDQVRVVDGVLVANWRYRHSRPLAKKAPAAPGLSC